MEIVKKLLNNKIDNHMYPFFWQHGESNEKILEYIEKIQKGGIQNLCIESRPHPEFLQDGWWKTMDFIIAEAKKRDMKIWILDDAKFPTGFANGQVPENLKKKYVYCHRYDVVGTSNQLELDLRMPAGRKTMYDDRHKYDKVYKIILVERNIRTNEYLDETRKDITNCFKDGFLYLELEKKHYAIFVICKTSCGDEDTTKEYLDPTRKEATRILINEVYEKHYQRYKDEFGKTITAFFSDEPRFGNAKGTNHIIGKSDMPLPWNENIEELLKNNGVHAIDYPSFFEGNSDNDKEKRFIYMDVVSQLYSENFSQEIGTWCKEHNVIYVGHTIEDNNAHARLAYGTGHYFRGMRGQHMAGIDIIGGQIVPGMNYHHDAMTTGGSDGEFYHYALCRLGASEAKLDPKKEGRLMCEAFGAYGWGEGLKMMKWITDHMLSHGVNYIVPHAFSPKEFPDWDCPPHFYAHGNNPQYPYFHYWTNYANRLCNLLSGGYQICRVGVLYHAFNEWHGDTMLIQKVLKELQCNQIDSNIISEDYLLECQIINDGIEINGYRYDALIIPEIESLPKIMNNYLTKISKNVNIIFINRKPTNYRGEGKCVKLDSLSTMIGDLKLKDISLSSYEPELVYYHYQRKDGEVMMFTNENVINEIQTSIYVDGEKELMIYDAHNNKTYALDCIYKEGKTKFDINLHPYESLVLVSGNTDTQKAKKGKMMRELDTQITISMKAFNESEYQEVNSNNLSKDFPRFSGNIMYEFELDVTSTNKILDIEEAYEIVEVLVNDISCGVEFYSQYTFDISKALIEGINNIKIITTNNLGRSQRDMLSTYFPIEPIGIISNIKLYEKKEK
ncbi:MAG: hypothetical protein ACK5LC_14730 [Coprobacillaceae bacterium]